MFKFKPGYLIAAGILFLIEVCIALFVHDHIIRPYIGDVLVVILIYSFLRSFLNGPVWALALFTLLFSYLIETLQYFKFVELLGLDRDGIARVVLGTSFAWMDILCYTVGIIFILVAERVIETRTKPNPAKANVR